MWAVFGDGSVLAARRTKKEAQAFMSLFRDEAVRDIDLHLDGPFVLRRRK